MRFEIFLGKIHYLFDGPYIDNNYETGSFVKKKTKKNRKSILLCDEVLNSENWRNSESRVC